MSKKVFAFDLGKASIGYCVRDGLSILDLGSIIVDKDHAEVISTRSRRRVKRTLDAHKAREDFFSRIWLDSGLDILDKDDDKFKKEFAGKKETITYNSSLLRIALLQNRPLEQWQIYKAIHSAFQRRGYDTKLAWANVKSDDKKKNKELALKYTRDNEEKELIKNDNYKYPCYYDAKRLGLWSEDNPSELKSFVPLKNVQKVRDAGIVAPREMVIKELTQLWINAQKQLPQLQKISVEYFLYGEFREAYGSYVNPDYHQYRGTNRDWQGVLGQKVPRFDNRIIMRCKLLPKRNVCSADTFANVSFTMLMKLKNLRFTNAYSEKCKLAPDEISEIYENWVEKVKSKNKKLDVSITKDEIEKVIGKKYIKDEIKPMEPNISGRSSFCKRACQIMNKIILSGELYPKNVDLSEFVDSSNSPNPITKEEIDDMISKIGDWNNLFIPDNRYEIAAISSDEREKTDILIGNITNPIVRNRLQLFRDNLLKMKQKYGEPDEVIFEFIRDGADKSLMPGKKAADTLKHINEQEKINERIANQLHDVDAYSPTNFEKLKLLEMQDNRCIYSGKPIGISDFDKCEIDHIYPRTKGGNDALYNKVLCYSIENQNKKGRTPYEWIHNDDEKWFEYVDRLNSIKEKLGKKKFELLTSKPEECEKLIESYNGLAETAQIAKVAQNITAFIFGWGLQVEGQNRKIFVNNGSSTSAIRKRYGLNKLLGDDIKKNRDNDKHHALDAICISFSRDFKYDEKSKKDVIKGFTYEMVKKEIDKLIPYPYANKKPFKGNTRPEETIYGKLIKNNKTYLTKKIDITTIEQKDKKIKTISDEYIKNDLLNKLQEKMSLNEWTKMLSTYIHPKKQTHVKKVLVLVSEGGVTKDLNGRERIGEYADFGNNGVKGQFKRSKGHKGQILYYNEKGIIKVMPVYANLKTQEVKDKLESMGCKLYKKGMMFYSGCLIEIPQEFKSGINTYPAGIYKLRTIMANGGIKIENNNGIELMTMASALAQANFQKYNK